MLGRTFFVILFFWAALIVITPILIWLSASANVLDFNGGIKNEGVQSSKEVGLLSRRALGSIQKERPALSTSPSPKLHRQTTHELEVTQQPLLSNDES
ncbi:hypothetical protein L1987_66559 [Smallanthus sonchifolius]|uniref:Uncharacterized protein n=1 Tax=Smallanthus sonchifolius TaxID=185202 RepID=A0ACB9BXM3_9ASTR|nr:hypothetical protein L1987_66559 [Smallanthus sonchifolius]